MLSDERREFVASDYVKLEVLPKAVYFQRREEVEFYQDFFSDVSIWVDVDSLHWPMALDEACSVGLSAFDALHVTAALMSGCQELVTTEGPRSGIHRARNIKVVSIA